MNVGFVDGSRVVANPPPFPSLLRLPFALPSPSLPVNPQLAKGYPEYKDNAAKVKLVEVTSGDYYGKGYQDVQNRVPAIQNTMEDLGWAPKVDMQAALRHIFDAYRGQLDDARALAG